MSQEYICGVSLGAPNQTTAFVIMERKAQELRDEHAVYSMLQAERFPIGTNYPMIAERLSSIRQKMKQDGRSRSMVVDRTVAGEVVMKLFRRCSFEQEVTITNGHIPTREEHTNHWFVPKKDLASALIALFQTQRLKIAGGLPDALTQEILDFRIDNVKLKADASDYEMMWREGANDDYVFAAAAAAWYGEMRKVPHIWLI